MSGTSRPLQQGLQSGETGAASLMRALVEQGGIRVCFANPGTTEMWLVAALDELAASDPGEEEWVWFLILITLRVLMVVPMA